jgi:hypothetical protein
MQKVKELLGVYENHIVVVVSLILIAIIGFGVGKLSASSKAKTPIRIETAEIAQPLIQAVINSPSSTPIVTPKAAIQLVASRNGTRYYYPWCSGVKRIKEENKVYFNTESEAEARGLTLAVGCDRP